MKKLKYEDRIAEIEKVVFKKSKPWYKDAGVWFAVICFLVMCYAVYIFYLSELGYKMEVHPWLQMIIDRIYGRESL